MPDLMKAPECGTVYAVTDTKICYEKYDDKKKAERLIAESGRLLELHMFDSVCEYRYVAAAGRPPVEDVYSDSSMAASLGWDENEMSQHIYEERVFIADSADKKDGFKNRAGVVNYIQYDEDDMLHIVNYRLKEV